MAAGIPARLTASEGRRFGLTVGIAFLFLAALSRWRGHAMPPAVLGGLGLLLICGGLILPTHLGPVRRAWMGLAHAISKVTTPLFLGLVYFLVITPTGLLRRLVAQDPLKHANVGGGFWVARPEAERRSRNMKRQF